MADMENNKRVNYDIYATPCRPFFSYKKPGDGNAYCMVVPQIHSHVVTLKFTKSITSENRIDLNCYLSPAKLQDFVNILEGIMARRRDTFINGGYYSTDETFKIPVTRYVDGKETSIGALTIDSELVDGISRIRLTYFENEKNDSVEIVFNDRVPEESIGASIALDKIDYGDIQAYKFVTMMQELITPRTDIMYGIVNSAVSSLTRYISACFNNSKSGGSFHNGGNKSYQNGSGNSNSNYSDYEETTF